MSHTPGPWGWHETGDDWVLWGEHGMRPIVLDMGRVKGLRARSLRSRDTTRDVMVPFDPKHPNSRLIAAAPNLLAACKSSLAWLREHHNYDQRSAAIAKELMLAIAAAEGSTQ